VSIYIVHPQQISNVLRANFQCFVYHLFSTIHSWAMNNSAGVLLLQTNKWDKGRKSQQFPDYFRFCSFFVFFNVLWYRSFLWVFFDATYDLILLGVDLFYIFLLILFIIILFIIFIIYLYIYLFLYIYVYFFRGLYFSCCFIINTSIIMLLCDVIQMVLQCHHRRYVVPYLFFFSVAFFASFLFCRML